jgi:hypothetical protein
LLCVSPLCLGAEMLTVGVGVVASGMPRLLPIMP